jgi:hypothetical protein
MVKCRKHGLEAIKFVCPEVADAVRQMTPCPGTQRLAHFGNDRPHLVLECWFCPACVATYKLLPSGSVPDYDRYAHALSFLYLPVCWSCLEEWCEKKNETKDQGYFG